MKQTNVLPKRSCFRWHWSSFFFMLLPLIFFVLVAVPGSHRRFGMNMNYWEYGWPLVHLHRTAEEQSSWSDLVEKIDWQWATLNSCDEPHWSDVANWDYLDSNSKWKWVWHSLIVNVAICLSVCLLIGGLFERRRRRRASLFQISILDVLVLILLVASVLGYYQYNVSYYKNLSSIIERERIKRADSTFEDATPVWLERLADNNRERLGRKAEPGLAQPIYFERITEICFGGFVSTRGISSFGPGNRIVLKRPVIGDVDATVKELDKLCVRCIRLMGFDDTVVLLLDGIEPFGIEEIEFDLIKTDNFAQLENIGRFANLKRFKFVGKDLEKTGIEWSKFQHLESVYLDCQFGDETIEWLKSLPKLEKAEIWFATLESPQVDEIREELGHLKLIINEY